jgi:hypothetical protein
LTSDWVDRDADQPGLRRRSVESGTRGDTLRSSPGSQSLPPRPVGGRERRQDATAQGSAVQSELPQVHRKRGRGKVKSAIMVSRRNHQTWRLSNATNEVRVEPYRPEARRSANPRKHDSVAVRWARPATTSGWPRWVRVSDCSVPMTVCPAESFSRRYVAELFLDGPIDARSERIKNHGQKFTLRLIKQLARKGNVTLMCHCAEDQEQCHRHLLHRLISSMRI